MARLLIVGNQGGTNVAESFARSAQHLGLPFALMDVGAAYSHSRLVNTFYWRLLDRRAAHRREFGKTLLATAKGQQVTVLLTTGLSPVDADLLQALQRMGVVCMHYSTDDPWNTGQSARWFLRSLRQYDCIFTPRTSNVNDFIAHGCKQVVHLPFGYDAFLFGEPPLATQPAGAEVLFVGGADRDRVAFIQQLLAAGVPVKTVGGYWGRYPAVSVCSLGHKTPNDLAALTVSAGVNLCLVRRANRDGHVMRSFEIGALGGCMVAEDTAEHREIFGPEGECVLYFTGADQAAEKIKRLLNDPVSRQRLSQAVRARVTAGGHTYTHRLQSMLQMGLQLPSVATEFKE